MSETDRTPRPPPPPRNDPEFVHADPWQARLVRRWTFGAVVAVVALWLLFGYWRHHSNAYNVLHRMYGVCYLAGIGLLAVAWHAWRYARRIAAAGQYPPPGGWVFGRTRVLRGSEARTRGLQVMACAVALALLGLYSLYLPHDIGTMLMPGTRPIQIGPSPASDAASSAAPGKPHG